MKQGKEKEPDNKALLKELIAARDNIRQQIEWVGPVPLFTAGLMGPAGRDIQANVQLSELNATLKELEDCIAGLGGDDAKAEAPKARGS